MDTAENDTWRLNASRQTVHNFADGERLCSYLLESANSATKRAFGYVTIAVCLVGVVVNVFTIIVLTRKRMVTPVNVLLTALAVADSTLLVVQFPQSVVFHITAEISQASSSAPLASKPGYLNYYLFALDIMLFCRTVAVWEAVAVASFRYICVRHPTASKRLCTVRNAGVVTAMVVFVSALTQLPGWLLYAVVPASSVDSLSFPYCLQPGSAEAQAAAEGRLFTVAFSDLASEYHDLVVANSWVYAIAAKLLPPALLAVFTTLLLITMCRAEARRKSLLRAGRSEASKRARDHNLATFALFTVVVLNLLVELPQGVFLVIAQIFHKLHVYEQLGDVMNTATLFSMSINFFIYTTMMSAFRKIVKDVLLCRESPPDAFSLTGKSVVGHESIAFLASERNG